MKVLYVVTILQLLLVSGCASNKTSKYQSIISKNESQLIIEDSVMKKTIDEASNTFAFNIFQQVEHDSEAAENIMISPLSIAQALSMTLNGAEGETLEAMKSILLLNGYTKEEINAAAHGLSKILVSQDPDVDISIANSVWSRSDIPINKDFTFSLKEYYNAEVKQFKAGDPTVPFTINKWIEDKTDGMIKDMLDRVAPNIVMMLVNAICFDGKWTHDFDENATIEAPFFVNNDLTSTVKMMRQTSGFDIYEGDGFNMVELPYGEGNYVIDIILPDKELGIAGFLPRFTATAFNEWISQTENKTTQLSLPRFKYEYKKELNDILSKMGMAVAFSEKADLSGISNKNRLAIDKVTHKAFIETTEKGTKAAAATVVGVKMMSFRPENPFVFNIDHPFLYIIREINSNTVIFMGKVVKP